MLSLQLWEESQAENGRLRQDMTAMRVELEATKEQLENAFQVKLSDFILNVTFGIYIQANSSVSDAEKEERKTMERKLEEMEEKLKVFPVYISSASSLLFQSLTLNNVALAETEMVSSFRFIRTETDEKLILFRQWQC